MQRAQHPGGDQALTGEFMAHVAARERTCSKRRWSVAILIAGLLAVMVTAPGSYGLVAQGSDVPQASPVKPVLEEVEVRVDISTHNLYDTETGLPMWEIKRNRQLFPTFLLEIEVVPDDAKGIVYLVELVDPNDNVVEVRDNLGKRIDSWRDRTTQNPHFYDLGWKNYHLAGPEKGAFRIRVIVPEASLSAETDVFIVKQHS